MPSSSARKITRLEASSECPYDCPSRLGPPQPRPTRLTSRPLRPSLVRCMASSRVSAGDELLEGLGVVGVPAAERRPAFDQVSGGPFDALLVELGADVVVGAQDVEIAPGDAGEH